MNNEALMRALTGQPDPEQQEHREAGDAESPSPPSFDGGAREPAPPPSDPEGDHAALMAELLRAPTSGGGQW